MITKTFLQLDDLCDLEIESYGFGLAGAGTVRSTSREASQPRQNEISVSFGDTGGHYALIFKAYLKGQSFKQAVIKNIEILGLQGWWRQKSGIVFSDCLISSLALSADPKGNVYHLTLHFQDMQAI